MCRTKLTGDGGQPNLEQARMTIIVIFYFWITDRSILNQFSFHEINCSQPQDQSRFAHFLDWRSLPKSIRSLKAHITDISWQKITWSLHVLTIAIITELWNDFSFNFFTASWISQGPPPPCIGLSSNLAWSFVIICYLLTNKTLNFQSCTFVNNTFSSSEA